MVHDYLSARLAAWRRQWQRHRSRRRLRDLEGYLLDDVGIDRGTAEREARKPFWKA